MRDAEAYRRKLGTILESLEELPDGTKTLSNLETQGVLHLVQVAIDAVMDVAAMLTKDHGRRVRDDYHNLDELSDLELIAEPLAERLATLNGLRNAIVHKYNKFEESEVLENLDRIQQDLVAFVRSIDDHLGSQQPGADRA